MPDTRTGPTYFVAVRRAPDGNEWLDVRTCSFYWPLTQKLAEVREKGEPAWAQRNARVRIARCAITLLEEAEETP